MTPEPVRTEPLIAPAPELEVASSVVAGPGAADGDLVVRTASATLRLEGGVASVVRDRILPALGRPRSRADLRDELSDLPAAEIERLLHLLLDAGVLVETYADVPRWLGTVTSSGREREALAVRLGALRVVLIGQADVTGAVAAALTTAQLPPEHVARAPYPRQRDELPALLAGADLVIAATDGALPVLHPWVNTAGLESGVPALHVELRGARATVGPLVLPGEGPCYLCWRMRALACADDFAAAMALEEAMDARRSPDPVRPMPPALLPMVTGAVVAELFALTLRIAQPRLVGGVLSLNALGGAEALHPVLPRPDCPACAKKARRPRVAGPRTEQGLPISTA